MLERSRGLRHRQAPAAFRSQGQFLACSICRRDAWGPRNRARDARIWCLLPNAHSAGQVRKTRLSPQAPRLQDRSDSFGSSYAPSVRLAINAECFSKPTWCAVIQAIVGPQEKPCLSERPPQQHCPIVELAGFISGVQTRLVRGGRVHDADSAKRAVAANTWG